MAHAITVTCDVESTLLFVRMRATEGLGQLFSYELQLLSENAEVDLLKLLGKPMAVKLVDEDGTTRYFHGIVAEAEQTGFETISKVRYAAYQLQLVPKPWLLSQKVDCRIYTEMDVPSIVKAVLGDIGYADVKLSLTGNYPQRDYCVQYRESGLNFISRLMEQEGIYYFFTHAANAHTLVLADALGAHAATSGFEHVPYCPPTQRGGRQAGSMSQWRSAGQVHSLKVQLTDYNPLTPKASLLGTATLSGSEYHGVGGLDVFDYPGPHDNASDGKRYAQVQVEARNALHKAFHGQTDAFGIACGALFTLQDFPLQALNREYLITRTIIELADPGYYGGADAGQEPFRCELQAIPSSQPFRSLATAAKPRIAGLQTAVVCGSDTDEDIAVDKYGRVQVTFPWNKPDKPEAKSSCPVRVASPWAGKNWGAVSIPRVGQEVVVSFLEGDPDRPLIIGSVYNADNMPPYSLPDNKTQSGVKTRSLLGGTDDANELRFEDKKGSEQFFIHAQKDMLEEVENDHTVTIDHDETVTVKNDQKLTVNHDQTMEVGNDQTETVKHDRKITVQNDDTLDVTANGTTSIGQKFKLSAGTEIELVTGASSITMKSDGTIEIKGVNIKITGDVGVKIEGQVEVGIKAGATMDLGAGASLKAHSDAMLEVAGSAMTTVKGAMTTIKGDAMTQVSGSIIMIG
ncbi:MAG: type IV secretion protein Rhs [Lysobacterales bacterium 14-68-21]|jgi:type VI secretion system secreted protein VgrG|nr:MAG: type IV secretion protein Rhs [Xanthomonadales bacterium 15-68-25]OZB67235.1 MAG: type IV secretion protein Rhs [Xanthomonadales bacterium 14-68-21]